MTSRYDPSNPNHKVTCTRIKCVELERAAHPAGVHLDQRHEFYDGPDGALGAASIYIRDSARKIVREAPGLMPEVMDLVTYVEFLQDQVTHARVDRDRGIRDAMAHSESCEYHGEQIKALNEQVSVIDVSAQKSEKARLALLGLLQAIDDVTEHYRQARTDWTIGQLVDALEKVSKKAHAAHARAWG